MKADEIVMALRKCSDRKCGECVLLHNGIMSEDDCRSNLLSDAADLIESLTAQLAASQRRERAAVESWERAVENSNSLLSCEDCLHRGYNDNDGILCKLKSCKPEYRGPSGEGEDGNATD